MGIEEDRIKAMQFDYPEYIPVTVRLLLATWIKYGEALEELVAGHPVVFGEESTAARHQDELSEKYHEGEYVDEWGCVWDNIREGCGSIVTGHPVPTREMIHSFKPPPPGAGLPHGFIWLRLADLRGFEEIMVDFAEEPPELQMLIDKVLEYSLGETRAMLEDPPQLAYFGDDLGLQRSLPISPAKWRKYMKPCFAAIYGLCHEAGTAVYMHTDGHIVPIINDLIDCGVNVVNAQIRANGLDRLVEECKGKLCVDLDLDRQMFPFCTPADIDAHVRECAEKLGGPEGGLWLTAECGPDVPLENIEAICQALEKYRPYFN